MSSLPVDDAAGPPGTDAATAGAPSDGAESTATT